MPPTGGIDMSDEPGHDAPAKASGAILGSKDIGLTGRSGQGALNHISSLWAVSRAQVWDVR